MKIQLPSHLSSALRLLLDLILRCLQKYIATELKIQDNREFNIM